VIDPEKLEKQRLSIVPKQHWETRCACGRRTTLVTGVCAACARANGVIGTVGQMTHGQLISLLAEVRAELKRRREEIDAAMGGT